jgi:hypothetical protein
LINEQAYPKEQIVVDVGPFSVIGMENAVGLSSVPNHVERQRVEVRLSGQGG